MCLGVCSHCTQFLKFELLCSQWDFQRGKSYFSYCTVCSLRADTMSNRSVSHKTPTLSFKKIYLLNIVWLCFFYKWKQDSCHLPQNALIIPPSLTYSFHRLAKPCLQLRGASTRVLQHFKLYITKTQLTFHSNCLFSSVLEKHHSGLQNLPPGLSRTLCNCSWILSIFVALLLLHRPWLKSLLPLPKDWNNVPSNSMPSLHGPILNTARAIF